MAKLAPNEDDEVDMRVMSRVGVGNGDDLARQRQ